MGFRNWLTKNASKTAETVITQTKETLQKSAETNIVNKGNALFTLGKLALLGLIFVLTLKEAGEIEKEPVKQQLPASIVINNYMNERKNDDD